MSKNLYKTTHYNDIALKLSHKLLKIPYLHYGYFSPDMKKDLSSLPAAQELYVEQILSEFSLPNSQILDIGCGVGSVAEKLLSRGHQIHCVDPDPYMIETTRSKTFNYGAQKKISFTNDFYENVIDLPPGGFDYILMSESCQYVDPDTGWSLHSRFLKKGGKVIIADFFKIRPLDQDYLSKSGHEWEPFLQKATRQGFSLIKQRDITSETAPTMDIYQEIINEKILPIAEALTEAFQRKFPKIYMILRYFFKKKLEKLAKKYKHQDSQTFAHYKAYYLLVFQK